MASLVPGSARAEDLNDGPYTVGDGIIPDAGAQLLDDVNGSVKELGPKNASSTKIGVIHSAPLPMLDKTNPNAQVDLDEAYLDMQRDANGHDWVYFGWKRDSNTGSGFISFEFMKDGTPAGCANYATSEANLIANCNPWRNRRAGDFLILWDQQGGSTTLYKRVWSGTYPNLTLSASQPISNGAARYGGGGFFGEAAVDITAEGLSPAGACVSFANVIPSTVTGNSDTADYKDTILAALQPESNCVATIATTPRSAGGPIPAAGVSIGTGVVAVHDRATISMTGGSVNGSGAIEFYLCKMASPFNGTNTCTAGGTAVGTTNLANAPFPQTVDSPTAYLTSVGDYCWYTEWDGDAAQGIAKATDASAGECFKVTPATPTIDSTTASASGVLGTEVSDTAVLSGTATKPLSPVIRTTAPTAAELDAAKATGTITYRLYDSTCSTVVRTVTSTVSGNGSYPSPNVSPTVGVGTYHWRVTYGGDSPNTLASAEHNTTCSDTNEDVTITDVPSTMTTAQTWVPRDSATITAPAGSGDLNGTVTFKLFSGDHCNIGEPDLEALFTASQTITDGTATGAGTTVNSGNAPAQSTSGSYSWLVDYDSTNPAQRDIAPSCHETSALTITNGGSVSSTP
ncbi:hemagglutinin [Nocardioides albidus]|uniref:Hemagglutinin n=1 Tax=Nocardioides albidus TaxID=1517589 RepID=A0A5C4W7L0_9ACTN|nr:hemagglutinin [Nocardioides albidus]TNM44180.1 hemagglutinin [Nocardioides albidus]